MRRRPNALVLLLLLLLGLYWGYEHHQTKQYLTTLRPIYHATDTLQQNLESIYDLGEGDEQLIPGQITECERMQNTLCELKAQLSETIPPTSGAAKAKETLSFALSELHEYSAAHAQYLKACLGASQKLKALASLGKQLDSSHASYSSLAEYTAALKQAKAITSQLEEKKETVSLIRTTFLKKTKKELDALWP